MAVIDVRASWLPPFIWFDTRFPTHLFANGCRNKWCRCDQPTETMTSSVSSGYITFNVTDVQTFSNLMRSFQMLDDAMKIAGTPTDFLALMEDLWASRTDVPEDPHIPCAARERASARAPPDCVSLTAG